MTVTDVERIPVETATRAPAPTNAYLVGEDATLLVDPAGTSERLDAVAESGIDHIALTHTHPDHVDGVATYAERTGATVWARRGREAEFAEATGVEPDRTFIAGTTLPVGDGVTVIDTPGHAADHVAFETDTGLVSGDVALSEGSVVVPAPEGDMRAYLVTLRRLRARDPVRLYPGHGPAIDDPQTKLTRLIEHRRKRERHVEDAILSGARTFDDVLDAVYDRDLGGVRDLARATIHAHVEKLAAEGHVQLDAEAERIAPA